MQVEGTWVQNIQYQVSVSMLDKTMDFQKLQAEKLLKMVDDFLPLIDEMRGNSVDIYR